MDVEPLQLALIGLLLLALGAYKLVRAVRARRQRQRVRHRHAFFGPGADAVFVRALQPHCD